jgi:menaquinone-9 beta-reductase
MYDLIVIGGGPAGTAAAILCARKGARVLLLERGRFPRHKVCGEFVSAESLALLAELLGSEGASLLAEAIRIPDARMFVDGRVLRTSIEPAAASVARLDLDNTLWKAAERAGVDARQQVPVQKVSGTGPFLIESSLGEHHARAVVNATGRWSNLNVRSQPNGKAEPKWIGLKAHFAEAAPAPSVDLYFFDGGYCGVQPVDLAAETGGQRINACAMVRADVASTLSDVLRMHPALRERARQWQLLSDPVSVGPLLFRKPRPESDGVLRVGDAAAFVDPFVGDGISLALRSGALAAQSLTAFFDGEIDIHQAARRYVQSYQQRLAVVLQASSRIRRMMLLPRAVRAPILFALEKTPAMTRHLVTQTRGL